jgi:protocatechuate 3,4-dioxygenase beta subunit
MPFQSLVGTFCFAPYTVTTTASGRSKSNEQHSSQPLIAAGNHQTTCKSSGHPCSSCKRAIARESLNMAESVSSAVSRRRFLYAVAVAAAPMAFLARVKTSLGQGQGQSTVKLDPTPAAGEKLVLTPEETAGPFFKPNSPLKNDFRDSGVTGTPVKLTGFVLDRKGRPIPNALLDFWHADANGEYDFNGFRCRGHQFTGPDGKYALETIMPGLYPGRTRHYHARLQAAHGRLSSTFRARRAIRPILCTSEICCSRYESQAQAESPLSTSFWKRSELKCGLRNESGGACRSATAGPFMV